MKIIVGLGNPGKEYDMTRHNIGFMALDAFHKAHTDSFSSWTKKFNAEISDGTITRADGTTEKILLMKPLTFMNLSGESIAPARGFYKVEPIDVLAVYDDADIPFGTLRFREAGSAGGHNGVKSLITSLGTDAFPRIKIGIGTEEETQIPREDFVLQKFTKEEQEQLATFLTRAVQEINTIITRLA